MNKLTPYEQSLSEQLTDLPLPDENQGWLEMKKLLEKDDDDGTVIPPPPQRGCGMVIGLLLLLLAGIAWYFLQPQDRWGGAGKKNEKDSINTPVVDSRKHMEKSADSSIAAKQHHGDLPINGDSLDIVMKGQEEHTGARVPVSPVTGAANVRDTINGDRLTGNAAGNTTRVAGGKKRLRISGGGIASGNDDAGKKTTAVKRNNAKTGNGEANVPSDKRVAGNTSAPKRTIVSKVNKKAAAGNTPADTAAEGEANSALLQQTRLAMGATDSLEKELAKNKTDSLTKKKDSLPVAVKDPADSSVKPAQRETKKKKYYVGAGLAAYKGLPLNGAMDVAVNNYGRKGALTDYIPSVYLRLYREEKWFIQSEFRYGVPQYNKAFVYKQNEKVDTSQILTTSSYVLRKTYYHQVPLSFNYFILPGWSVGAGIVYNRLTGAISEETIRTRVPGTANDSLTSFKVINDKKDSAFVKNTVQWLVETQYKWKRFSIGARYAQGLQPYIRYTDPTTGQSSSKKSNALYLFLRYELWNSKPKK